MRVGQFQKLNKLRAAVPCAHQSENLDRQQVDARQKGDRSVPYVPVVAPDHGMFAWYRRKVGRGVLDG
jgi:hypothetical protein